jgi:hypothetical protein
MWKREVKQTAILAAIIGALYAFVYYMCSPSPVIDETPAAIEEARAEVDTISRDVVIHNIETVREVRVIRETMEKSVAALEPDGLVLSIDEFIGRWREPAADKLPPGSTRLDL